MLVWSRANVLNPYSKLYMKASSSTIDLHSFHSSSVAGVTIGTKNVFTMRALCLSRVSPPREFVDVSLDVQSHSHHSFGSFLIQTYLR